VGQQTRGAIGGFDALDRLFKFDFTSQIGKQTGGRADLQERKPPGWNPADSRRRDCVCKACHKDEQDTELPVWRHACNYPVFSGETEEREKEIEGSDNRKQPARSEAAPENDFG
jgi:hypothetical protein